MTFAGEVLHVLKKDMRQARYMLAGYVVLAAVGAFALPGDVTSDFADLTTAIVMVLLLAFGAILVAGAVQEDSPLRETAFWASRPLRPGAVSCAKLLFGLVVLLVAVAAQTAALAWLRISASEMLELTLVPASIFALVLAAAAFIAAGTQSVGQFADAGLSLMVAMLIAMQTRHVLFHMPELPRLWVPLLLLGTVLVAQYRRKAVRVATLAGAGILLLGAFTRSLNAPTPLPMSMPAAHAYARDAAATTATLTPVPGRQPSPVSATYVLSLPASVPDTLVLGRARLIAVQANGREDTVSYAAHERMVGAFRRDGETLFFTVHAPELQLLRSAETVKAMLDLTELRQREVANAMVKEGAYAEGFYPLRIRSVSTAGRWLKLRLQTAGLGAPGAVARRLYYGYDRSSIEFALVDEETGRESMLEAVAGRSVSRRTLLPGADLLVENLVVRQLKSPDFTPEQLQRSRLVVRHWYRAASYRTTIPVTLEQ